MALSTGGVRMDYCCASCMFSHALCVALASPPAPALLLLPKARQEVCLKNLAQNLLTLLLPPMYQRERRSMLMVLVLPLLLLPAARTRALTSCSRWFSCCCLCCNQLTFVDVALPCCYPCCCCRPALRCQALHLAALHGSCSTFCFLLT